MLQTVIDSIETGDDDSSVARQIENTTLLNPLSSDAVRWLISLGATPQSRKALARLQQHSAALPASPDPAIAYTPEPTPDQVIAFSVPLSLTCSATRKP